MNWAHFFATLIPASLAFWILFATIHRLWHETHPQPPKENP